MADNSSPGLDEELLGRVALQLGNKFFRAGLLLGIQPHDLDSIQSSQREPGSRPEDNSAHNSTATKGELPSPSLWQMNMQVLRRWRENTSPESERLQLAQVLKRLGLGRFASTIDTSVSQNPGPQTFIDPRRNDFTLQELEEISREVGEEWERLGIYLHISDHTTQEIKHRNEDISVHAFRCLWAWYEGGEDVSRRTLAEALRRIHKGRLASRICS